jgi:hypothetical protein
MAKTMPVEHVALPREQRRGDKAYDYHGSTGENGNGKTDTPNPLYERLVGTKCYRNGLGRSEGNLAGESVFTRQ